MTARALPTGAVTFLFTDVEGSTRLLDELGTERYAEALTEHRRRLREAFARHGGVEVDTQGDAFFYAFGDAGAALTAAVEGQEALAETPVRVRMGVHTGTPLVTVEGYVGVDVHKAARVAAAGHGGQVLVSEVTRLLVGDELRPLGTHRLKDLTAPEPLWQLGDGDFPPLKSLNQSNLPVQPTPFVGRERELGEVLDLLRREDLRALTLTGPGGSGKTRLAMQAAAELLDEFPHGVWWVPLQAIADPALVEPTIASTLGAKDGLAAHLVDRRLLLVIDNFEQVVDAAPVIGNLLAGARGLKVVVTSREPLHLTAEQEYGVPPFVEQEAVGFFVARARAASPNFVPNEAVAEVCHRLDYLPLALELAAARVKTLPPDKLLEHLDRRLPLLTGGPRDAPERQRTLRATIEWSYDLLSTEEQTLFRRLAVFAGGASLQAAQDVAGATLDLLAALVDKSLVRTDGERFVMLETIREYASEQLDRSDDAEGLRERHARFFLTLAESAGLAPDLDAPQRHDLVLAEAGNVRAALDWCAETKRPQLGLSLAATLDNFWVTTSPAEGRRRLETLLAQAMEIPPLLRARALRAYGNCMPRLGEAELEERVFRDSLEQYEAVGDERGIAFVRHRLGEVALRRGDLEQARLLAEQSLAGARKCGVAKAAMYPLALLGQVEWKQGRPEHAVELARESARIAGSLGIRWWEALTLGMLAEWSLELGRPGDAENDARKALAHSRAIGDRIATLYLVAFLAVVAALNDRWDDAGRLWGAVEVEAEREPVSGWAGDQERLAKRMLADPGAGFAEARTAGVSLPFEEAVELALTDR